MTTPLALGTRREQEVPRTGPVGVPTCPGVGDTQAGREKEDRGCAGSVQEVADNILVTGNSAGATGRIRDRELGIGVNLTKCIKNLCFSTITKTKGYKSGCIYKTRRYCFTCKQVPDQTGTRRGALRAGAGGRAGSSPSAARSGPEDGRRCPGVRLDLGRAQRGPALAPGLWGSRGAGRGGAAGRRDVHARGRGVSQVLAALQLAGFLSVGGGGHADVHHVVAGGLVVGRAVGDLLLGHDAVDFCEDVLERFLYIGGIQG